MQQKIFIVEIVAAQLIQEPNGSRNFAEVTRTLMIRQDTVGLKPKAYQKSLEFIRFGLVWFISLMAYQPFMGYLMPKFNSFLMVGWLFGFYGISTSVGYLMPNPFLCK